MIVIRSNGSTWQGEEEKPIEHLFDTLANYTLDPRFGNGSLRSSVVLNGSEVVHFEIIA